MKLIKSLLLSATTAKFVDRADPDPCADGYAIKWLNEWNTEARNYFNGDIVADWNNNVDLTDEHAEESKQKEAAFKGWVKDKTEEAKPIFRDAVDTCLKTPASCCLKDEQVPAAAAADDVHKRITWTKELQARALDKIMTYKVYGEKDMDSSSLEEAKLKVYQDSLNNMVTVYNTQKIVSIDGKAEFSLEPELYEAIESAAQRADQAAYEEQVYYWYNWHHKVGRACKADYETFVEVSNEAADKNNYADTGASWRDWYEDDAFETNIDALWDEVKPLYSKLHGYVRFVMNQKYGDDYVRGGKAPIPSHIFGNMWAQSWESIYPLVEPFDKAGVRPDATPALEKMETIDMYKMSEQFFTSIGMWNMTQKFWDNSVIEKKPGVEMVCHASAWDFMDGDGMSDDGKTSDYRIKQCTTKTHSNFVTLHHEMGHIVYFQQYAHQPIIFRSGGNPGFHEAIGDTIALAVNTPGHLKEVGLLDDYNEEDATDAADLNYLMQQALDKVSFLPFGLLMDKYRWGIFAGTTTPDQYQEHWDALRLKYQGMIPPVKRSKDDFDAAAKFHISNNVPYIRYFVSFIVQFQFYEKMCIAAGQYDPADVNSQPLYKCDFYKSAEAGKVMEKMMSAGNSQQWQDILNEMLGTNDASPMSADSIKNYFAPLTKWLDEQQAYYGYEAEWEETAWEPIGFDNPPQEAELAPTPPADSSSSLALNAAFGLFLTLLF